MIQAGRVVIGFLGSSRNSFPVAQSRLLYVHSGEYYRTTCIKQYNRWRNFSGHFQKPTISPPLTRSISLKRMDRRDDQKTRSGAHRPSPALPATVPVELSRVMLPDDTNPSGNVHGGTILKLMEQAGNIVATRHCNRAKEGSDPVITVLARADHIDFLQPMYVGEVSQLQAAVTYTSPYSLEVTVDVWAENVVSGTRRHTNTATLWYVAVPTNVGGLQRPVPVPPLQGLTPEEQEKGLQRYRKQKMERSLLDQDAKKAAMELSYRPRADTERHTVLASQSTLASVVLPSDCLAGYLMGGTLMKMMDSAAGICAVRHCRTSVVTACIDAINFHEPILNGEVVFVTAGITFTSNRSIEIEVTCEAEGPRVGTRRVASTAYFTFVSIGGDHHAQPVPPLVVKTDEEKRRFEEGKARYHARKEQRR